MVQMKNSVLRVSARNEGSNNFRRSEKVDTIHRQIPSPAIYLERMRTHTHRLSMNIDTLHFLHSPGLPDQITWNGETTLPPAQMLWLQAALWQGFSSRSLFIGCHWGEGSFHSWNLGSSSLSFLGVSYNLNSVIYFSFPLSARNQ